MDICDKCGEHVPLWNNAVVIHLQATANWTIFSAVSRHFLPTDTCPGSPSRAQYIEGQPRDTRPGALYNPHLEATFRQAFEAAVFKYKNEPGTMRVMIPQQLKYRETVQQLLYMLKDWGLSCYTDGKKDDSQIITTLNAQHVHLSPQQQQELLAALPGISLETE